MSITRKKCYLCIKINFLDRFFTLYISSHNVAQISRFLMQITTNNISLTGIKFFSVTRSLVLTVSTKIQTRIKLHICNLLRFNFYLIKQTYRAAKYYWLFISIITSLVICVRNIFLKIYLFAIIILYLKNEC